MNLDCVNIETLYLCNNNNFTDEYIYQILDDVKELKYLYINGCNRITAGCLSSTIGTSFLFLHTSIKEINLMNNNNLDDRMLAILGSACVCLEIINMSNCNQITDVGFLTFFRLQHNTKVYIYLFIIFIE